LQLQQHEKQLDSLGVKVVVVTFEIESLARAYVEDTGISWPVLVDPLREIYRAYGMERGKWWQIYGPPTLWLYFKLAVRGRKALPATGDPNQLGGDILIDPEGIVRLHHVGSGPADRPTVAHLLDAIQRIQSRG